MNSVVRRLVSRCVVAVLCVAAPVISMSQSAAKPPGLPDIELFFRKPAIAGVQLSPSGQRAALLAAGAEGRVGLFVVDIDRWDKPRLVAGFSDVDVRSVQWVNDERLVFDVIDYEHGVDQQWGPGLWAVNADGTHIRRLISSRWDISHEGAALRTLEPNHRLLRTLRDGSSDIVVLRGIFQRDELKSTFPLRLNTETAEIRPLVHDVPAGDASGWWVDSRGVARAVETADHDSSSIYWRADDRSDWQLIHHEQRR